MNATPSVPIYQWVVILNNCETWVTWAETKQEALQEFRDRGYSNYWRILRKGKQSEKPLKRDY